MRLKQFYFSTNFKNKLFKCHIMISLQGFNNGTLNHDLSILFDMPSDFFFLFYFRIQIHKLVCGFEVPIDRKFIILVLMNEISIFLDKSVQESFLYS